MFFDQIVPQIVVTAVAVDVGALSVFIVLFVVVTFASMYRGVYYILKAIVFQVKYSAHAECEIIHFVNCEILLLRRNVK
jgi:hypothetical protein